MTGIIEYAEKMDHMVAAIVAMVGLLAVGYKILVYVMQMYGSNNLEITFLPDRKRREYQVANWIMLFIAIWIASTAIGYLKYNGEFQEVIEIIWVAAFGIMVITLLICIVHRGWGKIKTLFNKSVEKNTSKFPSIWEQAFLSVFLVWGITTSGVPVYDGKILLVFKWSTVWSFIIMEVIIICVAFNKKTLHAKMSFYSEKYQKNLYVYTITDKGIYICGDSARMEKRTECNVIKEEDILDKQIKLPPWEEK